jgi:hypothetical protein
LNNQFADISRRCGRKNFGEEVKDKSIRVRVLLQNKQPVTRFMIIRGEIRNEEQSIYSIKYIGDSGFCSDCLPTSGNAGA